MFYVIVLLLMTATSVLSYPRRTFSVDQTYFEVVNFRASTALNPAAVIGTTCDDPNAYITSHDLNVAELAICGGIASPTTHRKSSTSLATGSSGTAHYELEAIIPGAKINISKKRWEDCVRAAVATCPTGSFTAICRGGDEWGCGF